MTAEKGKRAAYTLEYKLEAVCFPEAYLSTTACQSDAIMRIVWLRRHRSMAGKYRELTLQENT